jgi:hypothetical protein
LLADRGMTLAVTDNATHGEVARRLRNTPHGQVLLAEPPASEATHDDPARWAEHLAQHAKGESGASLGLAVFAAGGESMNQVGFLSLSDGAQSVTCPFSLPGGRAASEKGYLRRWLSTMALDLVRRYLIDALEDTI